ncbi:integrator complex subunit 12 [Episyrphus balteatus]|uniref:integrator complex subunit 12 n=1 Tax=Episyrphus balteatus TaxID=286459 RepID=UPI002485EB3F|nr:integrator complex subunit 12 [Episyrphus balteatus]
MAAATTELDTSLKQALNFLHSTNPQSAEEIRNCLDDIIKQRYGSSKMLANTISQKHLDEEPQAPGTIAIPIEVEDLTLTQSPKTITDSPTNTLAESDDMGGALTISEEVENLKEFGDLKCVVCGEMIVTATNRLIECSKCGSLYHQTCHKPNITDEEADEQELSWNCSSCQSRQVVTKILLDDPIPLVKPKSSSASSSRSSSSSTSSSPYYRHEHSSSSSSRHNKGISSSSKKSSSSREPTTVSGGGVSSSKSSTSSTVVTPSINVISADKTGYSSKKSSHSSGSSSSKSKSKHHESGSSSGGSSKRKSSK